MSLRKITQDWKHIKSFANEGNLTAYIEKVKADYPDHDDRFIVVRTPEGRWTATVKLDMSKGGYIGRYEFVKM